MPIMHSFGKAVSTVPRQGDERKGTKWIEAEGVQEKTTRVDTKEH